MIAQRRKLRKVSKNQGDENEKDKNQRREKGGSRFTHLSVTMEEKITDMENINDYTFDPNKGRDRIPKNGHVSNNRKVKNSIGKGPRVLGDDCDEIMGEAPSSVATSFMDNGTLKPPVMNALAVKMDNCIPQYVLMKGISSDVASSRNPFLLSIIYASPSLKTRKRLWTNLENFTATNTLPWVIAGDCNDASNELNSLGGIRGETELDSNSKTLNASEERVVQALGLFIGARGDGEGRSGRGLAWLRSGEAGYLRRYYGFKFKVLGMCFMKDITGIYLGEV
ncbi:hypothetical protein F3Y22_tig00004630pilonHSYRG00034 [Hibiscus syriacus]|uniref:Uncharacterized protein n=1 Tax=Hibiscus syriacus TaxID=106335 RepID=A0A6A3CHM0_HIBSY|nr:hypothetical protein F3Y22_tig00004630pilonHSYRG00034 [Hibiscus syriacus]